MSCSDKMARWTVLGAVDGLWWLTDTGLQGAILSAIIDPIYMETLVVGSMYNEEALQRAIVGRLSSLSSMFVVIHRTNPVASPPYTRRAPVILHADVDFDHDRTVLGGQASPAGFGVCFLQDEQL